MKIFISVVLLLSGCLQSNKGTVMCPDKTYKGLVIISQHSPTYHIILAEGGEARVPAALCRVEYDK